MINYKNYFKKEIGTSDYASLIICMPMKEGLIKEMTFGQDGTYTAYIVDEEAEIGNHYKLIAEGEKWLKIYDDEGISFRIEGKTIKIYRAAEMGCIIQIIKKEQKK